MILIPFYIFSIVTCLNVAESSSISSVQIEEKIQEFQQTHVLNGAVAVAHGGETIYANGFGFADKSVGQLCTKDTQFFIGSLTKQFTVAALLHVLWHRNPSIEALKVALQLPLSNYLPASDSIWAGSMPEWATKVTLHQLLSHTSGIASYSDLPSFQSLVGKPISVIRLTNMFKNEPLNFEPGEKFHYCNSGYFLLGEVVERVAGKTLSKYLADNFFIPLGMHRTFAPEIGNGKTMKESGDYPNLARVYNSGIEPNSPMIEIEKYFDNTFLNGVAGVVSTVSDLLIWNDKLHHNMILSPEVTELMLSEHVLVDPKNSMVCYCYGMAKVKYPNGDVLTHAGDLYGFSSTLAYRPRDQLSFSTSTNIIVRTSEIEALQEQEHKNLKYIQNQNEYISKLHTIIENKFSGFLAALERHRLMRLEEIVGLYTK